MESIIITPTYFPSISHYMAMVQSQSIVFETEDNFQKQTNRSRAYIYSPNGVQLLNVPIQHQKNGNRQLTKDIKIDYSENWQKQHFKSLEAAYRSSPFFEFFEDEIAPIFEQKEEFLLDLNIKTFELINACINLKLSYSTTEEYFHESKYGVDFRHLANGKKDTTTNTPYTQVFDDKHGFIPNLSMLDLLFNEGNYCEEYLRKQII
ncbi:MAG: WbqC family protein [Flavobacteriales bacterium]|nr:WbqC family protein [Flavobacteriales bacterium]